MALRKPPMRKKITPVMRKVLPAPKRRAPVPVRRPAPAPPRRPVSQLRDYVQNRLTPTVGAPPAAVPPPEAVAPQTPAPPPTPAPYTYTPQPLADPSLGNVTVGQGRNWLSQNPQLPMVPSGAYTDAQFVGEEAGLRQSILSRYNDVLQQLGFVNPEGGFVQGQVQIGANRTIRDAQRSRELAALGVTREQQGLGTLFSGRRGEELARAEQPYVQQVADVEAQLPGQLSQLYGNALDILREYEINRNQMLLEAAARRQAAMMEEA